MVSAEAQELFDKMAEIAAAIGGDGPEPPTLEHMRREYERLPGLAKTPAEVTFTEVDAAGVRAIWADPAGGSHDRVVEYVHGGGFVLGGADGYRALTGQLAAVCGCRVLSVDYRLAPEHPYPAALNDATAVYQWLLDEGFAPDQIALAGDSAGGGLALSTMLWLRDSGLPLPAAAAPFSPWADLEGVGDTMTANADTDVLVGMEMVEALAGMYLAGHDPRDPLASPIYADYSGLPPIHIQVGDAETLLDDTMRVAEAARSATVDVTVDVFPSMQHVFQFGAGTVPEFDAALAQAADFLRRQLDLEADLHSSASGAVRS